MVHALREAWRVLVADGSLIDLRPVAINPALEVVTGERAETVHTLDGSAAVADDAACDAALESVVGGGAFQFERGTTFWSGRYWGSVAEMRAHIGEKGCRRFQAPTETVILKIAEAMGRAGPAARIRIPDRMIIARYKRTSR